MYQSGARVCDPNDVTPSQWKQILALKARSARLKTYQFMGRKAALKSKYKVSGGDEIRCLGILPVR